jgi:hypothetical protein
MYSVGGLRVSSRIRNLFEQRGFILREWEKGQTDTLCIVNAGEGRHPRE